MAVNPYPTDKLVKAMFGAMLSAPYKFIEKNWRVDRYILLTVKDGFGKTMKDIWARSPSEVPVPLYDGPNVDYKTWRVDVSIWRYGVGGRVVSPTVTMRLEKDVRLQRVKNDYALRRVHRLLNQKKVHPHRVFSSRLRPATETITRTYPHYFETTEEGIRWNSLTTEILYRRSWTGTRTPNFWRLTSRERPVNNHFVLVEKYYEGGLARLLTYTGPNSPKSQFQLDAFLAGGTGLSGALAIGQANHLPGAYNRALSKLKDQAEVQVANLAQDLVQINQLTRMVTTTAGRIRRMVDVLKAQYRTLYKPTTVHQVLNELWHGKSQAFREKWYQNPLNRFHGRNQSERVKRSSLAENILEFQYGWKPLLQDVHDAAQAVAKMNLANLIVQEVKVSAKCVATTDDALYWSSTKVGQRRCKAKTDCKIVLRYRVDDHLVAFLAQIGATNPINLLWEVLPYSFVVDWFIPIGMTLETLTSWQGLVFVDGSKTQFTTESTSFGVDFEGNNVGAYWGITRMVGGKFCKLVRLNREKLVSFPPAPKPEFKNPFTVTHAVNALALLETALKGRRPPLFFS